MAQDAKLPQPNPDKPDEKDEFDALAAEFLESCGSTEVAPIGPVRANLDAAHRRYAIERGLEQIRSEYRAMKAAGATEESSGLLKQAKRMLVQRDDIDKHYPEAERIMRELVIPQTENDLQEAVKREIEEWKEKAHQNRALRAVGGRG